jgi:peptide/nickel transport system ATP-binding protein
MTAAPLVEVENVGRIFDVSKPWLNRLTEGLPRQLLPAVANVSFTIARRETFALVGESGSGKSTIAKMIVGLVAPTTGSVVIDGVSMTDPKQETGRRQLRRRIQMVFQDPYASLNPRWRARDIVGEPLRVFTATSEPADIGAKVDELLRLVGLDPADGAKYPHEFSGGQRQRIAIARALAARPDFIVCDEPTSALDVSVQAQILNLMRDLQDKFGLTYLFISHNLAVVRHMANRIGVLYLGRLVEVAAAKDLFRAPRHPYTRMLLDAVPDLDPSGRARKPIEGEVPNPIDPPPGCAFHPRCRYATARCRAEQPQLIAAGTAMVACHAVAEGRA